MQTVFYVLASIAAVVVIITASVLTLRALILMARLEDTRRDLAAVISETGLSLQHANRLLARIQEGIDRARHTMDRLERVVNLLQPAAAVGGMLAGAKRAISGRRSTPDASGAAGHEKENEHD